MLSLSVKRSQFEALAFGAVVVASAPAKSGPPSPSAPNRRGVSGVGGSLAAEVLEDDRVGRLSSLHELARALAQINGRAAIRNLGHTPSRTKRNPPFELLNSQLPRHFRAPMTPRASTLRFIGDIHSVVFGVTFGKPMPESFHRRRQPRKLLQMQL
jgi:hypothetical protein